MLGVGLSDYLLPFPVVVLNHPLMHTHSILLKRLEPLLKALLTSEQKPSKSNVAYHRDDDGRPHRPSSAHLLHIPAVLVEVAVYIDGGRGLE